MDIRFSSTLPGCDRFHYVNEADIRVVLSRLPTSLWSRLRAVHFNDRSRGARVLGYVNRGRREIALCALPPRISLTRFLVRGQTPAEFGARRGSQWPYLAVRRFMLYDVFLHELGHLQIVDPKAATVRRKFAMEPRAQEFADHWRRELWSTCFVHEDPVHIAPDDEESAAAAPASTHQVAWHNALTLLSLRRLPEALDAADKSLAVASTPAQRAWSILTRGTVLELSGDPAQAERALVEALSHRDLDAVRLQLAALLVSMGRTAEAEAVHREGLRLKPKSQRRRDALAAFLTSQGGAPEAEALDRAPSQRGN